MRSLQRNGQIRSIFELLDRFGVITRVRERGKQSQIRQADIVNSKRLGSVLTMATRGSTREQRAPQQELPLAGSTHRTPGLQGLGSRATRGRIGPTESKLEMGSASNSSSAARTGELLPRLRQIAPINAR